MKWFKCLHEYEKASNEPEYTHACTRLWENVVRKKLHLSGGIGALLSNSGGYLIGFIFIPLMYMTGEKFFGNGIAVRIISFILGLAICYSFGTAWFMYVYTRNIETVTLGMAMKWCVTPFIPFDLLKMALALIISDRIKKYAKL